METPIRSRIEGPAQLSDMSSKEFVQLGNSGVPDLPPKGLAALGKKIAFTFSNRSEPSSDIDSKTTAGGKILGEILAYQNRKRSESRDLSIWSESNFLCGTPHEKYRRLGVSIDLQTHHQLDSL